CVDATDRAFAEFRSARVRVLVRGVGVSNVEIRRREGLLEHGLSVASASDVQAFPELGVLPSNRLIPVLFLHVNEHLAEQEPAVVGILPASLVRALVEDLQAEREPLNVEVETLIDLRHPAARHPCPGTDRIEPVLDALNPG